MMGLQSAACRSPRSAYRGGDQRACRGSQATDGQLCGVPRQSAGLGGLGRGHSVRMEFYLLHYFTPGTYQQTRATDLGRRVMEAIGCTQCHIPNLPLERDRRVADIETAYDPERGIFNNLFATAHPLFRTVDDGTGF